MEKVKQQLPKDWKWVKFADIIEFLTDFQANGSFAGLKENVKYHSEKNYAVLVRLKDLRNEMQDEKSFIYTDEKGYNFLKKSRVVEGDILVANVGAGVGTTLRMSKFEGKATLGPNMFRVDIKDMVCSKYFFAFSNSINYWQQLKQVSAGSGQPKINKSQYRSIEMPLPPKPIQQVIVSKIEELFSELDKGIENLLIAQQQLKTYRQSVLKWAFEGKLTNDNTIEGELPEGWGILPLKDVCKIVGGVTKGKDFTGKSTIHLPYLRVANVQDGYLDLNVIKTIEVLPSDKDKYKLWYGDVLYTEGGDKDKLGRGTIWKNEIEDCIHQNHIFRARPISENFNSKYIAYFSQTREAKNYFFKHGKQTTNLASINLTILSNLPLPICSISEQNLIVQAIESRLSVADKLEESITQSLQQSEALRQSILKKAFEGKLI